jgi:hypothetical protein
MISILYFDAKDTPMKLNNLLCHESCWFEAVQPSSHHRKSATADLTTHVGRVHPWHMDYIFNIVLGIDNAYPRCSALKKFVDFGVGNGCIAVLTAKHMGELFYTCTREC